MSILTEVTTDLCHSHDECRENPEMAKLCYNASLQRGPVHKPYLSGYGGERYVPETGTVIARETVQKEWTDYNEASRIFKGHSSYAFGGGRLPGSFRNDYEHTPIGCIRMTEQSHPSTNWDTEQPTFPYTAEILTHESYVGRVVYTYHERVTPHWDSGWPDYDQHYAVVIAADGSYQSIATTLGMFSVDAPEEEIQKYRDHMVRKDAERAELLRQSEAARIARDAEIEANTPYKGRTVEVTKGRKVPRGTKGEVIWYGHGTSYGQRQGWRNADPGPMRVGIKDAKGTVHWTAASNVTVITTDVQAAAE